jgi:hypothetical protein
VRVRLVESQNPKVLQLRNAIQQCVDFALALDLGRIGFHMGCRLGYASQWLPAIATEIALLEKLTISLKMRYEFIAVGSFTISKGNYAE